MCKITYFFFLLVTPKNFGTASIKDDLKKFNKDKKFASANELAVYQFSILDKAIEYGCDKIETSFNGKSMFHSIGSAFELVHSIGFEVHFREFVQYFC